MRHDIAELDLSVRAYNCLKQAGIHYVEEIMDMSDADLMAVRHLGVSCLRDVREKLASWNPHPTYQELEEQNASSAVAELISENAKLRKLCADMHVTLDGMNEQSFSVSGYVFCADVCPHWMGECSMLHPDECWYEQALRELGIEVDE